MLSQNELLFKYNPFKIKHWKDEEIEEQLGILVDAYISDAETVMEMALNIENLANQMFLIGEMIARLQESSNILKADIENKTNQEICSFLLITYRHRLLHFLQPQPKQF